MLTITRIFIVVPTIILAIIKDFYYKMNGHIFIFHVFTKVHIYGLIFKI